MNRFWAKYTICIIELQVLFQRRSPLHTSHTHDRLLFMINMYKIRVQVAAIPPRKSAVSFLVRYLMASVDYSESLITRFEQNRVSPHEHPSFLFFLSFKYGSCVARCTSMVLDKHLSIPKPSSALGPFSSAPQKGFSSVWIWLILILFHLLLSSQCALVLSKTFVMGGSLGVRGAQAQRGPSVD